MKNLSPRLIGSLAELFPGSAHVHDLGLGSVNDGNIWTHAKSVGFVLVSKDVDFAERSVLTAMRRK